MKFLLKLLLVLLIVLGGVTAFFWTKDTNPDEMHAKYGGEQAQYVEATGMKIHYRVSGPDTAPVLIFIHGTSASLHTWDRLRASLENEYRVIAYDQPGHGLTGPHPERDYTSRGMHQALSAIYTAEKINQATLIGNSMGGWVAWSFALDFPDQVERLVLLDSSGFPFPEEAEMNLGFKIMQSDFGRILMKRITPRSMVAKSLYDTVSKTDFIDDAEIDRYWELLRYPGNREAAGDQFHANRKDRSGELKNIQQPTLILWGEEDQLVPVEEAYKFQQEVPTNQLIIYPGVGHLPMEEVPAQVAEDIRSFMQAQ